MEKECFETAENCTKSNKIKECRLGEGCYRKRREHFEKYHHPHLQKLLETSGCEIPVTYKPKISYRTLKGQLTFLYEIKNNIKDVEDDDIVFLDNSKSSNNNNNFNLINQSFEMSSGSSKQSSEEICIHGELCYRKNPKHFETFSHPHLNAILKICGNEEVKIPKNYTPKISKETLLMQLNFLKNSCIEIDDDDDSVILEPCASSSQLNSSQKCSNNSNSNSNKINNNSSNKIDVEREQKMSKNEESAKKYRIVVLDRIKNPVLDKLLAAAPYNFFLTTISDSPETHHEKLSLTFAELVDPNLGDLESSLQINFMVQIGWVLAQYQVMGHRNKPMTLLYGEVDMELDMFKHFLTSVKVKPPSTFGSHHTKMMVFSYKDQSTRIVISTANLVESDWDNRTQGLWISPRCRLLSDESDTMSGDSPTNFKRDIIKYLSAYKLSELVPWIKKLQKVDMSSIKVFFIGSVPGTHYSSGPLRHEWGHPRVARLLTDHTTIPDNNSYPVIVQCSSIGSLGPKPESWLLGDILTTFTSGKRNGIYSKPNLKFIYPSFENIASSYDGLLGGGCLPYSRNTHVKQEWLTSFMCQWISDKRHRTRAPPHIKSYCRISPDCTKLSYFLLTSANLSKAAWGMLSKAGSLNILSYEAGVLFLPEFIIGKDYFPLTSETASSENVPVFPLPYDVPPVPYTYSDVPWWIENIL